MRPNPVQGPPQYRADQSVAEMEARPPREAYRPVRDRIEHIDMLRGLALLGVIVMNVGSMVMSINAGHVLAGATLPEMGVMATDILLMFGKARSSFAFLFGCGFAILHARADAAGAPFERFYTRRLLALLLFGLINQVFLFWGDILVTYAVLGFILMRCRSWSESAFLKAGLILVIAPPLLHGLIELILGHPIPDLVDLPITERMARGLAAYSSNLYIDAVRENIMLGVSRHATATAHMIVGDLNVLGLFFLGVWSVRTGILTEPRRHQRLLRRLACWFIPTGLIISAVNMLPMLGARPGGVAGAIITASAIAAPVLAFGYISALALYFSRARGWLSSLLGAAGRMALTNYLLSGAIGTWVFYGYGLGALNHFGITELTLFGIGLFLALALASRVWLRYASHGPAEMLWRRLSY